MKVAVADDHVLVRDGITHTLKTVWQGVEVLEADDGVQLMELLSKHKDMDIILMDLFMPDTDGFQLLENISRILPEVPVVVLSASESSNHMRRAIDIGASGYVPKSLSKDIMISALQLVLSGGVYIPPASLLANDKPSPGFPGLNSEVSKEMPNLTGRQYDVLKLLITGLTNKEIAKTLGLSEYTVKIHVTAIFKALNVSNRTQAVIEAKKMGIRED
ncbi:MAG: response regulator transcription factor [Gammaproteobacteria bacterium]|nr:response regulator transcription factor [Gammaproteobacteria bacterium]